MYALVVFILLLDLYAIFWYRGMKRAAWLCFGLLFLNDTIKIHPFDSYTLQCTFFVLSLIRHGEFKREWRNFPLKFITFVLLVVHVLVVLADSRVTGALSMVSRVFNNFVPRFLALFVGFSMADSLISWRKTSSFLVKSFVIMGTYGFITYLLQANPYDDLLNTVFAGQEGIWSNVQSRGYRVLSTLSNPIVYGFIMVVAASFVYTEKASVGRNCFWPFLTIVICNAFLANSRTGIVAGVILIIIYAILEYGISRRLLTYISLSCVLFGVLYQIFPFVQDVAESVWDIYETGGENSGGSDVQLKERQLEMSLLLFFKHPYLGNGFNYFQEVLMQKDAASVALLAGLEGYGYKLLVEEGGLMIAAVLAFFLRLTWVFVKQRFKEHNSYSNLGIAWTFSFLFFIFMTGTYGGVFTLCMVFIGMMLKCSLAHYQKE